MEYVIALLGLAGGGLINLLADSLPKTRWPRLPRCEACGAPRPRTAWLALLALVMGVRGCPYCGTRLRWRAPLVEIIAAVGSLLIWTWARDGGRFWAAWVISFVFLLIIVIDVEHRLILHVVTAPAAILFALIGVLDPSRGATKTLCGGLAGFLSVLALFMLGAAFAAIVARARKQPLDEVAFGFGDVTLSGLIGLVVGWPGVVVALFLGILAAGLFSLIYLAVMILRRRYVPFLPIPYGPFLVLGAWLVYFGGREVIARLFLP